MSDFFVDIVNLDIQTSEKSDIQKSKDATIRLELLELIEIQIRWVKSLINYDVYYTSVIDEIVIIQTELDHVAYLLFAKNAKKCIAERVQDGNPEALEKLFVTTGRLLKM